MVLSVVRGSYWIISLWKTVYGKGQDISKTIYAIGIFFLYEMVVRFAQLWAGAEI